MLYGRTTLSKFLIEQLRGDAALSDLSALLIDVAAAIKSISAMLSKGALSGYLEAATPTPRAQLRQQLDALSNEAMVSHCDWGGQLAGMVSEELPEPYAIPAEYPKGAYLLAFDPLDGGSNIDVNVSVGTIFSVLRCAGADTPLAAAFLQPGREQVAAGYAIYGPATMMVLTVGRGTHGFTLDRETGNFILTHPDLAIPADTGEFAVNVSNERFWEPPIQRYIAECKAGRSGVREHDFNMRWTASMVAEVHRILMRGGVFLYPQDTKDPARHGRFRLLYEANPMAMLIEQAGGAASTGRGRIAEVVPTAIHQRTPVVLGSRNEVERIERYHREYDSGEDRPYASPLFNERSLFRQEVM